MLKIIFLLFVVAAANAQWVLLDQNAAPLLTVNSNAQPETYNNAAVWCYQNYFYALTTNLWRFELTPVERWFWQPSVPFQPPVGVAYWTLQDVFWLYDTKYMWSYNPVTREPKQYDLAPFSCSYGAFWTHPPSNRLYYWGGFCTNNSAALWNFDVVTKTWTAVTTFAGAQGVPTPTGNVSAVLSGDSKVVYIYTQDKLWQLDMSTFAWQQSPVESGSNPPGPLRTSYTMWWQKNLMLFGGVAGSQVYGDTWRYNGKNWEQLSGGNAPTPRYAASGCITQQGYLYLYGGSNNNDLWQYGPFSASNVIDRIDWKLDSATIMSTLSFVMSALIVVAILTFVVTKTIQYLWRTKCCREKLSTVQFTEL